MLEARLEDILSQMQNAGQVRVMVTFDNAQEKVIAADEQKSSGSSGISEASRPVKTSGSGGESPIILTERTRSNRNRGRCSGYFRAIQSCGGGQYGARH